MKHFASQAAWALLCVLLAAPAWAQDDESTEEAPAGDESADEESGEKSGEKAPAEEPAPEAAPEPEPEPEPVVEPEPAAEAPAPVVQEAPADDAEWDEDPTTVVVESPYPSDGPDFDPCRPDAQPFTARPQKLRPGQPPRLPNPPDCVDGKPSSAKWSRRQFTDFVRTILTFYVGDDNLLAGSEDDSPNLSAANEFPELFFDGLNLEKPRVITETHMVIYARMPGLVDWIETDAAFVGEFELSRDPDAGQLVSRFRDDGSYVNAKFFFDSTKRRFLEVTGWPFSADRFRNGYIFDLTWGGDRAWVGNFSPVPGIRARLDLERFYLHLGAKSLNQIRGDTFKDESFWGILGGLGPNFAFGPGNQFQFRYDANGGWFRRGTFQQNPFRSQPLTMFGVSQRVSLAYNTPRWGFIQDTRLLRNDPATRRAMSMIPFRNAGIGPFGFGLSGEFTTVWQTLIDADAPDSLTLDNGIAGAIRGQVRFLKNIRVGFDVVFRDPSFLLLQVPSLVPYVSFAEITDQTDQIYGFAWVDAYVPRVHLTPGFAFGLMRPASFLSAPDANGRRQLQVVRGPGDVEIMPISDDPGGDPDVGELIDEPYIVLSMRGSLRWNLSHMMAIIGEVTYTQDFNVSKVVVDPESGAGVRVLDVQQGRQLGLNLYMQAMF